MYSAFAYQAGRSSQILYLVAECWPWLAPIIFRVLETQFITTNYRLLNNE